jgi:hypothetical protein
VIRTHLRAENAEGEHGGCGCNHHRCRQRMHSTTPHDWFRNRIVVDA